MSLVLMLFIIIILSEQQDNTLRAGLNNNANIIKRNYVSESNSLNTCTEHEPSFAKLRPAAHNSKRKNTLTGSKTSADVLFVSFLNFI